MVLNHSEETKKIISEKIKEKWRNKNYRNKQLKSLQKAWNTERKKETSKRMKQIWEENPETYNNNIRMKKFRISHTKRVFNNLEKNYPLFFKVEEIIFDNEHIKVRCKNHNCPNSKEHEGWFIPTYSQLYERIRAIENPGGFEENNFYCCETCKNLCPLFNLRVCTSIKFQVPYTLSEYQTFRKFVLLRDNYECQFCGEKATDVHHERPQKLEPFFALDPEYAWSCCKECHYKYGHKDECSTGQLAYKRC